MSNTNESTTKDFSEMSDTEKTEAIAKIDKLLNTYSLLRSGLDIAITEETKFPINIAFDCLNKLVKRDEDDKDEVRKLMRNNPLLQKAFDLGRFSAKYLLGSTEDADKMYDCLVKDGVYKMPDDGYSMEEGNACFNELVKEGILPDKFKYKETKISSEKQPCKAYTEEDLRDAGFDVSNGDDKNQNSFWF